MRRLSITSSGSAFNDEYENDVVAFSRDVDTFFSFIRAVRQRTSQEGIPEGAREREDSPVGAALAASPVGTEALANSTVGAEALADATVGAEAPADATVSAEALAGSYPDDPH